MRRDIFLLIKPSKTEHGSHYPKDLPSKQTHLQPSTTDQFSDQEDISIPLRDASSNQTYPRVPSNDQQLAFSEQTKTNLPSGDMSSCDDCGRLFENTHDLQRHVKRGFPENYSLKRKRNNRNDKDVPPSKRFSISPEEK